MFSLRKKKKEESAPIAKLISIRFACSDLDISDAMLSRWNMSECELFFLLVRYEKQLVIKCNVLLMLRWILCWAQVTISLFLRVESATRLETRIYHSAVDYIENESIPSRDRTACFVDLHTDRNFIDELIRRAGVIMSHEEKRVWSRH